MELWASWAKLIAEINGEEKKELKVVQKKYPWNIINLLPYRHITTYSTTPFLITIQWINLTFQLTFQPFEVIESFCACVYDSFTDAG